MNNRKELLPGVFLHTEHTNKFKTSCFSINFLRPLCREEASLNALLPSVLLRGTRNYPDMQQISMLLDDLYGASVGTLIRKKGEVHSCGFYADFIEDAYTLDGEDIFSSICSFMRELIFEPVTKNGAFLPEYVENEKVNLCNTLASEINDKRSYATIRMVRTMCAGERNAIPRLGEQTAVEAISSEALYSHYLKLLATSRIEILYMGSKRREEVESQFLRLFAGLPRETLVSVGTEVIRRAESVKELSEEMDVTQGKLSMGFRTDCTCMEESYPALMLFNAIYGGCVTSKLFLNVREKRSLCYYVSSAVEKFKGMMVVSSGIEFENYEITKAEILRQLEECRKGNISEEELKNARTYLISAFRAAQDRPGSVDEFYLGQSLVGSSKTVQDFIASLERVTMEEIVAAANRVTLDTVYFLKGVKE